MPSFMIRENNLQLHVGLDILVTRPTTHLHQVIEVGDLPVDPLLRESSGPEKICRSAAAVVAQVWWPETQDPTEDFVASLRKHQAHVSVQTSSTRVCTNIKRICLYKHQAHVSVQTSSARVCTNMQHIVPVTTHSRA